MVIQCDIFVRMLISKLKIVEPSLIDKSEYCRSKILPSVIYLLDFKFHFKTFVWTYCATTMRLHEKMR